MENDNNIIKTLKPFGCALVIICFIAFLGICFSSGDDNTLPDYEAPQISTAAELITELETNVLPRLEGVVSCTLQENTVVFELEKDSFFHVRNIILNYFDASLVDFIEAGQAERG